jgi:hypothetical protein
VSRVPLLLKYEKKEERKNTLKELTIKQFLIFYGYQRRCGSGDNNAIAVVIESRPPAL